MSVVLVLALLGLMGVMLCLVAGSFKMLLTILGLV